MVDPGAEGLRRLFSGTFWGFGPEGPEMAPQWARRDILMSQDKNCRETIFSGNAEGSRNPWVIKSHGRLGC